MSYKIIIALHIVLCHPYCEMTDKNVNTAYVTSKGQLVVPSRIRRRFGIKPGTRVNFAEEDGRIIFQPVTPAYIHSFRGMFKQKAGRKSVVQEHLQDPRADRDREIRR